MSDGRDLPGQIRRRRLEREENKRTALDRRILTSYTAAGVLCATSADVRVPRVGPCLIQAYIGPELPEGVIEIAAGAEHGAAKVTIRASDLRVLLDLVEGEVVDPERMEGIGVALLDLDEAAREEAE